MKIIIGNDHGGYAAKTQLLAHLQQQGHEVIDLGCDSEEIVRYPNYAEQVATQVLQRTVERGILICSTGIGMSIAANRFPGIRAALCTSSYMAKMTRRHNDSNVLCLGGKITGIFELIDIVETWLANSFEGGRHSISLNLIHDLETKVHESCGSILSQVVPS